MKRVIRKGLVYVCGTCEEFFSSAPSLTEHRNSCACSKKKKYFSIRHQAVERRIFGGKLQFPTICLERISTEPSSQKGDRVHRRHYQDNSQSTERRGTSAPVRKPSGPGPRELKKNPLKFNASSVNGEISRRQALLQKVAKRRPNNDSDKAVTVLKTKISKPGIYRPTPSRKIFRCKTCGYMTIFEGNLRKHHETVHNAKLKKFESKTPFPQQIYDCHLCPFSSCNSNYFQRHLLLMHCDDGDTIYFKCDFCDYKATSVDKITIHCNTLHKLPSVTHRCKKCKEDFPYRQLLLAHLWKAKRDGRDCGTKNEVVEIIDLIEIEETSPSPKGNSISMEIDEIAQPSASEDTEEVANSLLEDKEKIDSAPDITNKEILENGSIRDPADINEAVSLSNAESLSNSIEGEQDDVTEIILPIDEERVKENKSNIPNTDSAPDKEILLQNKVIDEISSFKTSEENKNNVSVSTEANKASVSTEENKAFIPTEENNMSFTTEEKASIPTEENKMSITTEENKASIPTEENKTSITTEENKASVSTEENNATINEVTSHRIEQPIMSSNVKEKDKPNDIDSVVLLRNKTVAISTNALPAEDQPAAALEHMTLLRKSHCKFSVSETTFSCSFCDFQFIHSSFLTKHISFTHKSELKCYTRRTGYQCDLCLVVCDSRNALNSHLQRHT